MDFLHVVKQARAALHSEGRITDRTLQRQFVLDDAALKDLKEFSESRGQEPGARNCLSCAGETDWPA